MQERQPSVTAVWAAASRAAHQKSEGGSIFLDPFARAVVGAEACETADSDASNPSNRLLRLFIAARSRFAEDAIATAVARGVRQVVVLGAGLDTFSLRNPYESVGLRVFEVDHPATQTWKCQRLTSAGLYVAPSVVFVSVDLSEQTLDECLGVAGFDAGAPAFFSWLGGVQYLAPSKIDAVLRFIANIPDSEVVFDYIEPIEAYPAERRTRVAAMIERAAAHGEPWLCYFNPVDIADVLSGLGFVELEDIDPATMAVRYFGTPKEKVVGGPGPHVIRAKR
jgi:methyltransferase (TIGR00027 family)